MSPRITILAFGTTGDVAPLTGLAARLRDDLGAAVAIAAQHPYRRMIADAGFEFRLLPRDTEADTRASTYGQAMVDGRRLKPSKDALAGMRDDLAGVGEAMAQAGEDADLLLCEGPVGGLLGWHVAEALDVPSAALMLQPSSPTGDFAPPPLGTRSYGRIGNRAAWQLAAVGEKLFTPLVDDLRAGLGLPHQSRRNYQRRKQQVWPQLYGYSRHVVPRPADWPDHVHVTGYWWPTKDVEYEPSQDLRDFLDDGPPPIYVGLGSTAISSGAQLSHLLAEALRASGQRAVIQHGWAHLDTDGGRDLCSVGEIPHHWLFPRVAAAVHHCGAGTTAATLRAGIPSVALPGIMDQPFWAQRLHQLGCAPTPIARATANVDELVGALTAVAVDSSGYRKAAGRMSSMITAEDGAGAATRIVEALLDTPRSATRP